MSRPPTVVAVGECTRDRYLDLGVERAGGISVNFAIMACRAGAAAAVVSCTGTDDAGEAVRFRLAREEVDATHLHRSTGVTATQAIETRPGGERVFPPGGYDPGVLATFRLEPGDLTFIGRFDILAAPWFAQIEHLFWPAIGAAAPRALRAADLLDGADLGRDLGGIDRFLRSLDLVFLSGDDDTVRRLTPVAQRHPDTVVVVTHGAEGSTALAKGRRLSEPAVLIPVAERVDTTGCGDAFQAAFSVAYFARGDLAAALRAGAVAASSVIRHVGATGS